MIRSVDRGDIAMIVFCGVGLIFIVLLVLGIATAEPPLPPGF